MQRHHRNPKREEILDEVRVEVVQNPWHVTLFFW